MVELCIVENNEVEPWLGYVESTIEWSAAIVELCRVK